MKDFFREEKIYIYIHTHACVSINRLTRSLEAWQREHARSTYSPARFDLALLQAIQPIHLLHVEGFQRPSGRTAGIRGRVTTPWGGGGGGPLKIGIPNRHPFIRSPSIPPEWAQRSLLSRPRERTMNAVVPLHHTHARRDRLRSGACERAGYWYHARRICHRGWPLLELCKWKGVLQGGVGMDLKMLVN